MFQNRVLVSAITNVNQNWLNDTAKRARGVDFPGFFCLNFSLISFVYVVLVGNSLFL